MPKGLNCCMCSLEGREVLGRRIGGVGLSLCRRHRAEQTRRLQAAAQEPAKTTITPTPQQELLLRAAQQGRRVTLADFAKPADATLH